jgi:hypothetical protein
MARKHGSSSTYRSPGTASNLRLTAREQRRKALRGYKGPIAGDARIIEAHMRNELGYCVIHDAYDDPAQPASVFHRQ